MKISIISEILKSDFGEKLLYVINDLDKNEIEIEHFNIDDCDINACVGCFNCWVKTPGVCIFKDDMTNILKSQINSDWIIFIAPIIAGTISYKTKSAIDRSLPISMPYIGIYNGECHHVKRYDKYPNRAMLIIDDENATDKAMDVLKDISKRNALNCHAEKMFVERVNINNIEERIYEVINS